MILLHPKDNRLGLHQVTLTPATSAKRIRFGSILATDYLSLPYRQTPKNEPTEETLLEALARGDAEQLKRQLAQEQLHQADSIRVIVPVMDTSIPKQPRKTMKEGQVKTNSSALLKLRVQLESWEIKRWGCMMTIDIRLPWAPSTKEDRALLRETIEGEAVVEEFMKSEADGGQCEEDLIRGMRTFYLERLESIDVDVDLDYGLFEKVLWNEKVSGTEMMMCETQQNMMDSFRDFIKSRKRKPVTGNKYSTKTKKKRPDEPEIHNKFSANSLQAFMTLRGWKSAPSAATLIAATIQNPAPFKALTIPVASDTSMVPIELVFIPAPKLPSHLPPSDFIAYTTLLSRRILFRHIKALYATARFIERDFSVPFRNNGIFTSTFVATRSSITDADLILSPTTGLVVSTLQRLRQRSLPGERATFTSGAEIKERIVRISNQYERLIVVIQSPSKITSNSDLEVVAAFLVFATMICKCIVVSRVVEGGEQEVARWLVGEMNKNGFKLIKDETMWEQFLRKAGLNAFASQVILRASKEHDRFRDCLRMYGGERKRRFERLVSGRVLDTVERLLDTIWEDQQRTI